MANEEAKKKDVMAERPVEDDIPDWARAISSPDAGNTRAASRASARPGLRGAPAGARPLGVEALGAEAVGEGKGPDAPPLPAPFTGCRIITNAGEAAAWKQAVAAHNAATAHTITVHTVGGSSSDV